MDPDPDPGGPKNMWIRWMIRGPQHWFDAGDSQLAALHHQHRHGGGLHPAHQGLTQRVPETQGNPIFC
jgi:hypothetical protein